MLSARLLTSSISTKVEVSGRVGGISQTQVKQSNSQVSPSYHPTQPSISEGHMMGFLGHHRQHSFSTSTAPAAVRRKATPQPSNERNTSQADTLATSSTSGNEVASPADPWTEVVHKETGQIYYWNHQTDETTALGEPKPGPQGRMQYPSQTINRGTSLLGLVGVGAGVGLVFAILGRLM